jgi:AraC family transcriptional regulator, transcriptional activator of pobA
MKKIETLQEFYKREFDWMPDSIRNEIGHFNVFALEPFLGDKAQPVPYKRRDYFKIMLVIGSSKVNYADKVVEVQRQALFFSNPQIPYQWQHLDNIRQGSFCIFNHHFFLQYRNLNQYAVFQPAGAHLFELTDEQVSKVQSVFERMFEEINSDYLHKYDVLRTLVFELIHFAMKIQPSPKFDRQQSIHATQRISTLFLELLERQFPVDDNHPSVNLRTPSDYAHQLNVPVNHLNRAVNEITEKTTSQLIAGRVLQEAKILLKHGVLKVADIAYALGFKDVTHFNNFFKKHVQQSPLRFRSV